MFFWFHLTLINVLVSIQRSSVRCHSVNAYYSGGQRKPDKSKGLGYTAENAEPPREKVK